jgi:hypothetical protein
MILLKGRDIAVDCFTNVGNSFLPGAASANATRKTGTFGNPVPVLARVDDDLTQVRPLQIVLSIYGC